jgi:hypothetical protein
MVKMIALRDFPLKQNESRRTVRKDEGYEIAADQVEFHENTGRGKRKTPLKKGK